MTPFGPGELQIYVEASTTPRAIGVSGMVADANADSGSALDGHDEARIQVSEFLYTWQGSEATYTIGLLDASGFLDTSNIANNESQQFIAAPLVNKPTIQVPDYTLGGGLHWHGNAARPQLYVVGGGSHGLADNPDASYSDLVDLTDKGKGAFVGELEWEGVTAYRLGIGPTARRIPAWMATAQRPTTGSMAWLMANGMTPDG